MQRSVGDFEPTEGLIFATKSKRISLDELPHVLSSVKYNSKRFGQPKATVDDT